MGETPETEIGERKARGMMSGEQRGHAWVPFRGPATPVMDDSCRVGIRLRVDAVDDQHPLVVLLKELPIVAEVRVEEVARLPDVAGLSPVIDDLFAGRIRFRIAKTRRIPAPVRLNEDEELAVVVGGVREWQLESRHRAGAGGQQALDKGASFHLTLLKKEIPVIRQKIGQHHDPRPDDRVMVTVAPPVDFVEYFVHAIPVEVIVRVAIIVLVGLQGIVRDSFEIEVVVDIADGFFFPPISVGAALSVPHFHEQLERRFHLRRIDGYRHPEEFFVQFDQLAPIASAPRAVSLSDSTTIPSMADSSPAAS